MEIKDKVFIITGAGGGIGRELALNLLAKGANVAAIDLRKEGLKELEKLAEKKDRLSLHDLDITDKAAVDKLVNDVQAKHGKIDALINNAGIIQPFVKINDLDYKAINRVMDVNFYGTLYMTKTFLPQLLERPEGYIVNVSSMGGFLPVPGQSIYGASKAAVKLMTEGLYAELKETNIHVSVVFPGATNTDIAKNSGVNISLTRSSQKYQTMPAEEAARIIVAGIEKNKPQIFVGKDSKTMNFLYRLSPVYATNLIAGKMKDLLK